MLKILNKMSNIPKDKLLHSFYGMLLFLIGWVLINIYFGLLFTIVIAIIKEVYDEIKYKGFSFYDLIATILLPILVSLIYLNK